MQVVTVPSVYRATTLVSINVVALRWARLVVTILCVAAWCSGNVLVETSTLPLHHAATQLHI